MTLPRGGLATPSPDCQYRFFDRTREIHRTLPPVDSPLFFAAGTAIAATSPSPRGEPGPGSRPREYQIWTRRDHRRYGPSDMARRKRARSTEESPPLTVFTFLLTLPYAVPIPDGSTPGFVDRRTDDWDGWSPELTGRLVDGSGPLADDVVPGTRMAVRHREVTMPVSPAAAFDAFRDWIEPPLPPDVFARLAEDTRRWGASGVSNVISVAALPGTFPARRIRGAKT